MKQNCGLGITDEEIEKAKLLRISAQPWERRQWVGI
jgi:hypothetical protein